LHLGDVDIGKPRIGLINQQSNGAWLGNDFINETDRHGIEAGVEDNRNDRRCRLGCER
jgi:hypothetical protein